MGSLVQMSREFVFRLSPRSDKVFNATDENKGIHGATEAEVKAILADGSGKKISKADAEKILGREPPHVPTLEQVAEQEAAAITRSGGDPSKSESVNASGGGAA